MAVVDEFARLEVYVVTRAPAGAPSGLRWLPAPAAFVTLLRHEPGRLATRLASYHVTFVPVRGGGPSHRSAIAV